MSTIRAGSHAAGAARRSTVSGEAARPAHGERAPWNGAGRRRWVAWLAVGSAGIVLLAAACGGGSPGPAVSPGQGLYQRELTYSECMRTHGVPDFPILRQGRGGS